MNSPQKKATKIESGTAPNGSFRLNNRPVIPLESASREIATARRPPEKIPSTAARTRVTDSGICSIVGARTGKAWFVLKDVFLAAANEALSMSSLSDVDGQANPQ